MVKESTHLGATYSRIVASLEIDSDFSEVSALRVAWLWHFREAE